MLFLFLLWGADVCVIDFSSRWLNGYVMICRLGSADPRIELTLVCPKSRGGHCSGLKRGKFRLGRMTKQQPIEAVAGRTDAKKSEVEAIAEAILKTIADSLASGERVDFRGFGSFEAKDMKARMGRNPATGEALSIAATRKVTFKPSKDLKEKLTSKSTDIS